jgi:hypothetical protein
MTTKTTKTNLGRAPVDKQVEMLTQILGERSGIRNQDLAPLAVERLQAKGYRCRTIRPHIVAEARKRAGTPGQRGRRPAPTAEVVPIKPSEIADMPWSMIESLDAVPETSLQAAVRALLVAMTQDGVSRIVVDQGRVKIKRVIREEWAV